MPQPQIFFKLILNPKHQEAEFREPCDSENKPPGNASTRSMSCVASEGPAPLSRWILLPRSRRAAEAQGTVAPATSLSSGHGSLTTSPALALSCTVSHYPAQSDGRMDACGLLASYSHEFFFGHLVLTVQIQCNNL